MMDLFPVRSSVIAAVGYDPERRVMLMLYNSSKAYEYHHVPPEVFWRLMSAESKGRFMNQYILGVYPFKVFQGWDHLNLDDLHYGRYANRPGPRRRQVQPR
jgi:hypothetical protein